MVAGCESVINGEGDISRCTLCDRPTGYICGDCGAIVCPICYIRSAHSMPTASGHTSADFNYAILPQEAHNKL